MSNLYIKKIGVTNNRDFKDHAKIGADYLYQRWDSVYAVLQHNIDEKYQFFFARPEYDVATDTISWYTRDWGEECVPMKMGQLEDSEEQDKYNRIFVETFEYYENVLNKFSRSSDEYKILKRAIQNIDNQKYINNFVFAVDEKVVCLAWGMTLLENLRTPIDSIIMEAPNPIRKCAIRFTCSEHGEIKGNFNMRQPEGYVITSSDIPNVIAKDGYEFIGWGTDPEGYIVDENKTFIAQFCKVEQSETENNIPIPIVQPWYKRLWSWFLRTWWKLLFAILLFFIASFILKKCVDTYARDIINEGDKNWIDNDDRVRNGGGGIYDPGNPYQNPADPTDSGSGYEDLQPFLPDQPNEIQPIEGEPEIIPGNPSVIGNRLNILMENESKSILDLVRAFKTEYPSEQYQVVYYDDVVKRIQIEFPIQERDELKRKLPSQFSEYQIFVFDETLFEGTYRPNDPTLDIKQKWYLEAVEAFNAWDITRGSEDITVAVVDNGFNLRHPELKGKIVMPYNVWSHDKNIFPQEVDHGTHVAGIVIGNMDNSVGIAGIAPLCTFMPIQVADRNGIMTTTSVLDGVLYALYQGADVINISLGQQFQGLESYPESEQRKLINNRFKEEERLWREVMKIAQKHNNVTIVLAAGNDNVLAGIEPLQRPELFITVSAVNEKSEPMLKADFSNYGEYSTISAPGVDIFSSYKGEYESLSGTSMAAPIVSGAVALLKSVDKNITNQQIICALQSTGKHVGDNIGKLLQINKAIEKIKSGNLDDCTPQPSTGDVQILLSWNNYNDLDLLCVDPHKDLVWFKQPNVSSGGKLEIDMNANARQSNQPIENIYWPQSKAPQGDYHVYIVYYAQHEPNINGTPYEVKIKYGEKEEVYEGEIEFAPSRTPIPICSFTLGN